MCQSCDSLRVEQRFRLGRFEKEIELPKSKKGVFSGRARVEGQGFAKVHFPQKEINDQEKAPAKRGFCFRR